VLERRLSEQKEWNLCLEWQLKEQKKMQEEKREATARANLPKGQLLAFRACLALHNLQDPLCH